MSRGLAYLLELRIRLRRNPEGRALVDRALQLHAETQAATDPVALGVLEVKVRQLEEDLAFRFGRPKTMTLQ